MNLPIKFNFAIFDKVCCQIYFCIAFICPGIPQHKYNLTTTKSQYFKPRPNVTLSQRQTWRCHNVRTDVRKTFKSNQNTTKIQRYNLTLSQRCDNVMCPLGTFVRDSTCVTYWCVRDETRALLFIHNILIPNKY